MTTVTLDHTRIHRRDIIGSTSLKPTIMTVAISGNFQFNIVYWHQPDSWPRDHQTVRQEGPVAEFQRKSLAATAYNIKRKNARSQLNATWIDFGCRIFRPRLAVALWG
ncbi:hypothetical protein [Corynebacterium durum]|uniref:hypothetical protein n=1 Tax=Corynebacterium durum TaxID=61592 RepID=UPI0028EBEADE|nr:hypothetical protein [Corynebacterium durum]